MRDEQIDSTLSDQSPAKAKKRTNEARRVKFMARQRSRDEEFYFIFRIEVRSGRQPKYSTSECQKAQMIWMLNC